MTKMIRNIFLIISFLLVLPSLALADDHWSDDWKVTVGGKAKSRGVIGFKLTFEPGDQGETRNPVTVDAPIPEKAGENDVADMIANAFRATLGDDDFKIDVSWGENVKIKAKGETPDFLLEITGNTVQGVSLEVQD